MSCPMCGSNKLYDIVDCSDNIGHIRIWTVQCPVCGRKVKEVRNRFDSFLESEEVIEEGKEIIAEG